MTTSVSERLAQEDTILREIRSTLSTYRTMGLATPRRKGAVYASSSITTGFRVYDWCKRMHRSPQNLRRDFHDEFQTHVMQPNLRDGAKFGERLRACGWPLVIVPGEFFAKGWATEHYMSLWRQVIVRYAHSVAFGKQWQWSSGCVEEFLIAVQSRKRILDELGHPYSARQGADLIRLTVDEIGAWGYDPKPLYDLWRQIELTLEAMKAQQTKRVTA